MVTWILLVVGGLNWGLEVFGWGIGNYLPSGLTTLVYVLVGLSALVEIFTHKNSCKHCDPKVPMSTPNQM
ncbi:MAG: hypothetical protein A3A96_03320 [Candidatus Zambryskibacteria bacterium RIFCSPLOWO2_01_FULL_39_39]|uniref:DUF378 domain-containing protein n=1 Tax=Candidatus Zambryskibacteria bacterium RIFCSPLOWO2_01_FULL_39_39 TaxID=1802758 RepID=A0A1G2TWH4_9BACT|nr:MAG: hypothetical protein A3A96_03320 [Candidatus Zambryskibacteria bacterium RIFCSPLOWO2_01_FULL_39_39]